MPHVRYSPAQKLFLKQHYHHLSNAELAHALGIDCPRKVLELARRVGVKWRAENGAPQWRYPTPPPPSTHLAAHAHATLCNTPNAQARRRTRGQRSN